MGRIHSDNAYTIKVWERRNICGGGSQLAMLLLTAVLMGPTTATAQISEGNGSSLDLLARLKVQLSNADVRTCSPQPDVEQGIRSVDWLIQRLKQVDAAEIPDEYRSSVHLLLTSVTQANSRSDRELLCRVVGFTVRDLVAKHQDCLTFGHARNKVNLEIRTVHNGVPQPNWEVYVVWLPEGDRFTGIPRRLENLSTPATGRVPFPGEFLIFAKHPPSQRTTPQQQISVAGADPFTWALTVPLITAPSLHGRQK